MHLHPTHFRSNPHWGGVAIGAPNGWPRNPGAKFSEAHAHTTPRIVSSVQDVQL